jgi:hypothetical protein
MAIAIRARGGERDTQIVALPRRAIRFSDDFRLFERVTVAFGRDRL